MACAHCFVSKKPCDRRQGVVPCSECARLGLECVPRTRKHYNGGKKRAAGAAKTKKTKKRKTGAPTLPAGVTFFTQIVHNKCLSMLSKLPSTHFGLQCAVKILHALARAKANWYLMTAVSWLATTTGIGGGSFATRRTTNRRLLVGNFDLPSFLLRVHDEAVGVPHDWEDSDRILIASNSEHIGGCVCVSPRYDRLFCNLPGFRENVVLPTFHSQEYAWRCITGTQVNRIAGCVLNIMKQYETSASGPFSRCVPDIQVVTEEGSVTGNVYITFWFGSHGLDMCEIHEFVPHDRVSSAARGEPKDTEAAKAILELVRK